MTIVTFREGEHVVAVLLDHFIAAQGRTVGDALAELGRIVNLTVFVAGGGEIGADYLCSLPPAPPDLWAKVKHG